MAVQLPINATPQIILEAVEQWIALLVKEDYQAAYEFTEQDEKNEWTHELIKAVICGYGLPEPHPNGKIYKITAINKAKLVDRNKRYQDVNYFEQPLDYTEKKAQIIGNVIYDLPLNGEWSDLSATFYILKKEEYITLELDEIHVF